MTHPYEIISPVISLLGEGPLWLPERRQIAWVDIEGMRIHFYTPATGESRSIAVNQRIGAAILAEDGHLVCALHTGFYRLNLEDESLELIAEPVEHTPDHRFNDGKCDPHGRFWAGTMPLEGSEPTAALYRLDGDHSVHRILTDIGCSNGLGWSLDGTSMYYIDTHTRAIERFDYDVRTGDIDNRQVIVHVPSEHGYPDGMAVDAEGMLWVAHWGGSAVRRYDPANGHCVGQIELPVSQVSSCCFGGSNLDELYITSARVGLSDEQLLQEPLAGSTFVVKPGVRGLPTYKFKVSEA